MKIKEFYAVTLNSIYRVTALGEYRASAVKIAGKNGSEIKAGHDICEGGMVSIGKSLLGFIPEGYGLGNQLTGFERNAEMVNTRYWRGGTSLIVTLFKTEEEARACLAAADKKPCDQRWIESTQAIIREIGDDHPSFSVSHFGERELLPRTAAA